MKCLFRRVIMFIFYSGLTKSNVWLFGKAK